MFINGIMQKPNVMHACIYSGILLSYAKGLSIDTRYSTAEPQKHHGKGQRQTQKVRRGTTPFAKSTIGKPTETEGR